MTDAALKIAAEAAGHPDVIRLFEDGLRLAKAGKIVGVGIVCVFDTGRPAVSLGGTQPLAMYYGCDRMKAELSRAIDAPPSGIIKVRN
jgi:hypothetical protein